MGILTAADLRIIADLLSEAAARLEEGGDWYTAGRVRELRDRVKDRTGAQVPPAD